MSYGEEAGNLPADYDSNAIADITIDVSIAGWRRPWTYQKCTEYGWFHTPSKKHPMRSEYLALPYWYEMCERAFPGLSMDNKPKVWANTIDQGGVSIASDKIFFSNGSEDPWRWATQQKSKPWLGQISELSDCNGCAHCAELYTPTASDPEELQKTRRDVSQWIAKLFKSKN